MEIIGGNILWGQVLPAAEVCGVSIDSRKVQKGDIFFALPGEKTDGHAFVKSALQAGAVGAVVKHWPDNLDKSRLKEEADGVNDLKSTGGPLIIQVDDGLKALQTLASWYRKQFSIPVIGVTGSTGKTTTKDLIAAALSKRLSVLKTEGNYNNELGVPLTLLNLSDEHQAAVVEMAMRGQGEIAELCSIATPTMGVITNIGKTHQELLGTQENIALAKGELLESLLQVEGWAVLNNDDSWQHFLRKRYNDLKTINYSIKQSATIYARNIQLHGLIGSTFQVQLPQVEGEIQVPVPGLHNVYNTLAALGVGWLLGLHLEEMAAGLADIQLSSMRLEIKNGYRETTLINDTYNANPDSMRSALEVLSIAGGKRKVAILGDMYELGDYTEAGHLEVGKEVAKKEISLLVTVGKLAEGIAKGARKAGLADERVKAVWDKESAIKIVKEYLEPGDVVLVKGSRGMRMEDIIKFLQSES